MAMALPPVTRIFTPLSNVIIQVLQELATLEYQQSIRRYINDYHRRASARQQRSDNRSNTRGY